MSPCTPFEERYGQTLGQFMTSLVEERHASVVVDEGRSDPWRSNTEARYLLQELQSIHANLSPRSQRLAGALRSFLARRVPIDDEHEWDLSRQGDLIVRSSGTISLIYFNVTTQQMDLSEIETRLPRIAARPGRAARIGADPWARTRRGHGDDRTRAAAAVRSEGSADL